MNGLDVRLDDYLHETTAHVVKYAYDYITLEDAL
jgi:hypothetical protein